MTSMINLDGTNNMRLLLIILMSIMAGCTTTVPNGTPSSNVVAAVTKATPHPVEPNWVTFTRKPVVREVKIGDEKGFIVTGFFLGQRPKKN